MMMRAQVMPKRIQAIKRANPRVFINTFNTI
jgi:hypothetical protein